MKATGLNHLSIGARDVDASVRFYAEMFGMEPIPTYNFGFRTQYLRCGDQQVHIFSLPDAATRYQHFAMNVDDFMAVYERAKAAGIIDHETFGNGVNEMPDGTVQLYLRDPGGNLVEVDWPDVDNPRHLAHSGTEAPRRPLRAEGRESRSDALSRPPRQDVRRPA